MTLTLHAYMPDDGAEWDAFVEGSKNGTFLFLRDYLEYHGDRFVDASLVARDEHGVVRALLPANRDGREVVSHAGLTYGGFVTDETMTAAAMVDLFSALLDRLRAEDVSSLLYKTVPRIYHRGPADEDLYALVVHGADLFRCDVLSVIDYGEPEAWEPSVRRRRENAGKAARAGVEVRPCEDWEAFWRVLAANLQERHGAAPVHSLEEIRLLAGRFPEEVRLYGAYSGGELEAGAVLYLADTVCHVQYVASTEEARARRSLDLLFTILIEEFRGRVRYFDFGSSTEDGGRVLNRGLADYKERYGARTVAHQFFRLRSSAH